MQRDDSDNRHSKPKDGGRLLAEQKYIGGTLGGVHFPNHTAAKANDSCEQSYTSALRRLCGHTKRVGQRLGTKAGVDGGRGAK